MPRVYKPDPTRKRYKKYDPQIIKKAVQDYVTSNIKLNDVAKKYGINKSVMYRHSTRNMKQQGGQRALSDEIELYLIEKINKCAEWDFPLNTMSLRYIVKMYLDKQGMTHKIFKNNFPGPDFVHNFLQRHKSVISQEVCKNIKRARLKVSPNTIKKYFNKLQNSLEGVSCSNIINYNEVNLSDNLEQIQVSVEKDQNSIKEFATLMMSGTADGKLLPPYIVYKALHLYDSCIQQGPECAQYNRSTSKWFDGNIFEDWIKMLVIPFFKDIPGKKCLIGDNLSSNLSAELIHDCKEHNINFVFLPSISTYMTQPLDLAFYHIMKQTWRHLLLKWKKTDGYQFNTIPKGCFLKLLKLLFDELNINASSNIIAGFKKTGIYPLSMNAMLCRLFNKNFSEDYQKVLKDYVLNNKSNIRNPKLINCAINRSENSRKYINKEKGMEIIPKISVLKIKDIEEINNKDYKTFLDQIEEPQLLESQKFLGNPCEEIYIVIVSKDTN